MYVFAPFLNKKIVDIQLKYINDMKHLCVLIIILQQ